MKMNFYQIYINELITGKYESCYIFDDLITDDKK